MSTTTTHRIGKAARWTEFEITKGLAEQDRTGSRGRSCVSGSQVCIRRVKMKDIHPGWLPTTGEERRLVLMVVLPHAI